MESGKFFNLFREAGKDFFRNPGVVIPGLILWAFIFIVAKISGKFGQTSTSAFFAYGWLVVFSLILIFVMSFIFAGLIGLGKKVVGKKKATRKDFISNAGKFGLKNFLIMIIIVLVSMAVGRIAHYGAFFIGKSLGLEVGLAQFVFILIYFAGLIGVLIWFTFSSFFLVLDNLKVWESIKKSADFVKKEYLATLSLSVVGFVVFYLLNMIPGTVGGAVEYIILLPYAVLVLVRLVVEAK